MLKTRKSGFTLIELLVVIAIIAILAAILFPVFAKAREKARQTTCASNEKQIGLGLMQYVQDYDEMFPPSRFNVGGLQQWTWYVTVQPYVKSTQLFLCPDDGSDRAAATTPGWACPATFLDADGKCRKGRSYITVGNVDDNNLQNGVMSENYGATQAKITSPAGMIMVTEGFRTALSVCDAGAIHYRGGDFLKDTSAVGYYYPSPGQVIQTQSGTIDTAFHDGGINHVFCDGHVKFLRYAQTFKLNGTALTWSMWDNRLNP